MSTADNSVKKDLARFVLEQLRGHALDKKRAAGFLNLLSGQQAAAKRADIAIVGMGCRFPHADSTAQFWDNLHSGRNSIREFPTDRRAWLAALDGNRTELFNGGFLDGVDAFDNEYFQIPPRVARHMDPYQRLMMEVLVETIEDAGQHRGSVYGRQIGVFIGNDHTHRLFNSYVDFIDEIDFQSVTGSWTAVLASRLSYLFNLRGPAVVVDTACSSGLVALDAAIKALRDGDCESALVGAANLFFAPGKGLVGDIENDTFEVRAFDRRAEGTAWGEGVAAVMIKPLDAALRDGDPIRAVIKGLAVNNDGASNGLTAPNAKAQQEVLLKAWERAGVSAEDLSYIETHGTGTQLGDPIEIKGLIGAFGRHTARRQFCAIGSVKTNIGHTVGVAGLASLIKVVLSMEHETLPPSLHFDEPNRHIDFCDSPVYIADRALSWARADKPRVAGISSFSLSGTNCHLVVQEPPAPAWAEVSTQPWPFALSARSPALLLRTVERHLAWCAAHPHASIADVCYTVCAGREAHPLRAATAVASVAELHERLLVLHAALHDDTDAVPAGWQRGDASEPLASHGRERRDDALARWTAGEDAAAQVLLAVFVLGLPLAWDTVFAAAPRRRVALPPQPFAPASFWDKAPGPSPGDAVEPAAAPAEAESLDRDYWLARIVAEPARIADWDDAAWARADALAHRVVAYAWSSVLGYERMTLDDDYYALGGDSIGAMRIVQMLNAVFGLALTPGDLLGAPRLGEFVQSLRTAHDFDAHLRSDAEAPPLPADATQADAGDDAPGGYPLSRAQRRMYLLERISAGSSAYNVNALVRLGDDRFDPQRAERILRTLIARHDILRTSFKERDGILSQVVHAEVPFALERIAMPAADDAAARDAALQAAMRGFVRPFDLVRPPLMRIALIEEAAGPAHLAIDMHHIVTDGSSMGVLMREYAQLDAGGALPPLPMQYRDFAAAEAAAIAAETDDGHARYWLERFAGEVPELTLQTDFPRPATPDFRGAKAHFLLDAALADALRAAARSQGATLFVLLLAGFKAMLHRMGGGDDIVVGSPVAGRERIELQSLIGMFVNTLALRDPIQPAQPFAAFLTQVRGTVLDALKHQTYPYEELVDTLGLARGAGRNALFDVCFALQNEDNGLAEDGGLSVVPLDGGSAKFDMTVMARESAQGIAIDWEYATALYSDAGIRRFAAAYERILRQIVADPSAAMRTLDPLSAEERELLLFGYNDTATAYPANSAIPVLFANRAMHTPDAVAIEMDGATISYGALERLSNRLAHRLIAKGVRRGDRVGLLYRRSTAMVAAILAVMKAGAAYVPLDVENPSARSQHILEDSGACLLLAGEGMAVAGDWPVPVLYPHDEDLAMLSPIAPEMDANGDDIACVMFTSGSTGQPKGALIRHKSIVRVVCRTNYLHLGADDVCLLVSNYAFDGSFLDLYGALLNGARLVLLGRPETLDMDLLADTMLAHKVTSSFLTTALFNALVETRPDALEHVRSLMMGGEAASPRHVARAVARVGPGRIINGYGPTECTVFATALIFDAVDPQAQAVPIGTAIANTRVYLFDADLTPVPHGVAGEIYIGGDGVALGYVNRDALNRECFLANPYVAGDVLYRTGDLAKRMPDGTIHFIGRRDHQVKIRGFRIELTEIEASILRWPEIRECLVVADDDAQGRKRLCAYVVPCAGATDIVRRLTAHLSAELPYYMVPSALVALEAFTLNTNGKIDRRALPMPHASIHAMVAPRDALEGELCAIWCELLAVDAIGVHDNFFVLGGDSIKAIQAVSRLQAAGYDAQVQHLMQFQTIAELAPMLALSAADDGAAPVSVAADELDDIFSDLDIV